MMITKYVIDILKKQLNAEIMMINNDSFEFSIGAAKVRISVEIDRIYMDVYLKLSSIHDTKRMILINKFIKLLNLEFEDLNLNERIIRTISIDNNDICYHIDICISKIIENKSFLYEELVILNNLIGVFEGILGHNLSFVEIYLLVIGFIGENYITTYENEYENDEYSLESEFVS